MANIDPPTYLSITNVLVMKTFMVAILGYHVCEKLDVFLSSHEKKNRKLKILRTCMIRGAKTQNFPGSIFPHA